MRDWMAGREAALADMLSLREKRAAMQGRILARTGCTSLICLTLNMAGPVKRTPLADLFFEEGRRQVAAALTGLGLDWQEEVLEDQAGLTVCFPCGGAPGAVKAVMAELEEESEASRLWDLDVLDASGRKVSRREAGFPERRCFLCDRPAAQCARSRAHSVAELQAYTGRVLGRWYAETRSQAVGRMAQRALLHEVAATPKPGLVDRANNGAHRDMDFFTFLDSACVLGPYFTRCARWGLDHPDTPPEAVLSSLRTAGLRAEGEMNRVTGGVNTHKGAIFSLGLLCAAAGQLLIQGGPQTAAALGALAGRMAASTDPNLAGARGEAASGFRRALTALGALRKWLEAGEPWNDALVRTLLCLLRETEDTNLVKRGGKEGLAWARRQARTLLKGPEVSLEAVERLDISFIQRDLSPGGCADLLAVVCFFYFWEEGQGAGA